MVEPAPRPVVVALPRYSQASGLSAVRWRASSNESVRRPSLEMAEAISAGIRGANEYPSIGAEELAAAIADVLGVGPNQVAVGPGSLSVLQFLLLAYSEPGTDVVHAWRSYEAYPIVIGIAGAEAVSVPLTADGGHDLAAMAAAVTGRTRVVIVCNPNNPTGRECEPEALRRFIAAVPSNVLIVVDEAYLEFASRSSSVVDLVATYPNLVVLRTFSKAYGIAGMRVGYLVSSVAVADSVRAVRPPFAVSEPAQAAALISLRETGALAAEVERVRYERDRLRDGLRDRSIATPVSGGNFVWIPWDVRIADLSDACLERGVSVRVFPGEGIRVTVGHPEVTEVVLDAVDELARVAQF